MYIENKLGAFLILLVIALSFWIYLNLSERDIIKEDSKLESIIQVVLGLFVVIGFFLAIWLVVSIVTPLWTGT